jgi:hypothetical protein
MTGPPTREGPPDSACQQPPGTHQKDVDTLNARVSKYARGKHQSSLLIGHIVEKLDAGETLHGKVDLLKLRRDLVECGSELTLTYYYTVNQVRLHRCFTCKQHLACGFCAILRATKSVSQAEPKLKALLASEPGLKPHMLTLTVPGHDDLGAMVNSILKALRLLVDRARRSRKGQRTRHTELSKSQGMIYSLEVKRGKNSGQWHAHIHALVLVAAGDELHALNKDQLLEGWYYQHPDQLPAGSLNREWWELTGGVAMDWQPVKDVETEEGRVNGLLEVLKYAVKMNEMTPQDRLHVHSTLKGKRLVASVGILRNVKIQDAGSDDIELELADLPYLRIVYGYLGKAGYSVKSVTRSEDLVDDDEIVEACRKTAMRCPV